jgi:hypothetical protein
MMQLAREAVRDLRYSDALYHLADATQLRPGSDAKQLHAVIQLLMGQFAEAHQLYQELQPS